MGESTTTKTSTTSSGPSYIDSLFLFVALYITTLFSTDAYTAAANSPYGIRRADRPVVNPSRQPRSGGFGGAGNGGGNGNGRGGGGVNGGPRIAGLTGGSMEMPLAPPGGCCG
ncbi:hypothetical protein K402DRAFT_465751 [Aulographum hederae CBS 113979]|uniref:Uncharacterized protein n=1 Tax=Aulographum hederae CBS 113979 TaxID=1176131 RepID=A0A6G1GSG8_9PEZI|nr:hypothetical protein K402DRAFT_465751 [Aulographum hederae CBS 113979]